MKSFRRTAGLVLFLTFGVFAATGCRTNRERYLVDAFSAEARLLEDRIYELHHKVETLERRLDQESGAGTSGNRPSSRGIRDVPGPRRDSAPRSEPRGNGFDLDDPDLSPPKIDPGTSSGMGSAKAGPAQVAGRPRTSASANRPRRTIRQVAQGASDRQVSEVTFDAFLLGNAPIDGSRVTGLELLILPINERDQLVPVAGEITVVVLNSVDQSHLGRWEYDASTARAALKPEGAEAGILLELHWKQVLTEPQLHVFVRFELPDGRRFESDRPFAASGSDSFESEVLPEQNPDAGVSSPDDTKVAASEEKEQRSNLEDVSAKQDSPEESRDPGAAEVPARAAQQREQGPSAAVYR